MRAAFLAVSLVGALLATCGPAAAAPVTPEEVRRLLAPHLSVCMEIPTGPYRIGAADRVLDAKLKGLEARGLVTLTAIGQGDSLLSGDSDLERIEEQQPFSPLVDVALADNIDRAALCPLSRHRIGVPLGPQTMTDIKVAPAADGGAQVLVEGKLERTLSKYAEKFDPALTPKATFQAVVGYDNVAKAWVVRRFVTQNVRKRAD